MIIVSYDIANDKLRNEFSKYLKRYGMRIQYSVFEIRNSKRLLDNIISDVTNKFEKRFEQSDSIIIIETSKSCKILKWGYTKNDYSDIICVD